MNEPLALLLCERGLIAVQLEQRLEGMRYRMITVAKPQDLLLRAETDKPMVVLADVDGGPEPVISALQALRRNPPTSHLPVIGFAREVNDASQAALMTLGITMVVTEAAVLSHLPQLFERALEVH